MKLLKKTNYSAKITKIEGKIPSITGLATTLIAVENKIPDVHNLVKKVDYNSKLSHIENKFITTIDSTNLLVKHMLQK